MEENYSVPELMTIIIKNLKAKDFLSLYLKDYCEPIGKALHELSTKKQQQTFEVLSLLTPNTNCYVLYQILTLLPKLEQKYHQPIYDLAAQYGKKQMYNECLKKYSGQDTSRQLVGNFFCI